VDSPRPQPIRVLLVEDRADSMSGHYAPLLRRIASGFDALGYEVTALTSMGLGARQVADGATPMRVVRYRAPARALERGLRRLDPFRSSPGQRPWYRPIVVRVRSLLIVVEARHAARSLGDPTTLGVVVLSLQLHPLYAAVMIPSRGHWAIFRHTPTSAVVAGSGPSRLTARMLDRLASTRDRRRSSRGGRFVVVGGYQALASTWHERTPWLATGVAPLPIESVPPIVDRTEARRQLDLPTDTRIALWFGTVHGAKSPGTVWSAWCLAPIPSARLVVAGHNVRAVLDGWLSLHPEADASAVRVIDGPIDDATKHLLFSAADFGICSFTARPVGASATLTDFAAYGRPVCCSSGGDPAALTRTYGLGEVFEAGDAASLAAAVERVGAAPDAEGLRAYLESSSESGVATKLHDLLFPRSSPVADRAELATGG
jgi:glycosyltransferase involved in cell wall biosynthesis